MYTLYNLLLNAAFIIAFPYLLLRAALGRHGILERMGRVAKEKSRKLEGTKVIWFHAASMGEVKALSTIIPEFQKSHPEYSLVASTLTKTGKREAERILAGVKLVFYLPLDLKRFVRRALRRIRPTALILVETELWPNLIREAKRSGSVVASINGRISERSLGRYRVVKSLFAQAVSYMDLFCLQSEEYEERMISLGASPDRIKITGNLKFDRLLLSTRAEDAAGLKQRLHISDRSKVIVAGSIREGEEKILLGVYRKLRREHPDLVLILAPRHLDRLNHLERILSDMQLSFIRRSQLDKPSQDRAPEVEKFLSQEGLILLDTMGELSRIYCLAHAAFVGGSLVPIGGHNLLEPAIYGVPVLFGPHVDNFKEEAQILVQSGGGIKVTNEEELYLSLSELLANDEQRKMLGEKARQAIRGKTGVARRTADLIFSCLEKR
jgi:3-deoxy-D-manno-octulosonic-acid transferase